VFPSCGRQVRSRERQTKTIDWMGHSNTVIFGEKGIRGLWAVKAIVVEVYTPIRRACGFRRSGNPAPSSSSVTLLR
jgi:hypothetical protein